jgi:ABC-type Fe3+-hydroxamate transport system substrate-binding protein
MRLMSSSSVAEKPQKHLRRRTVPDITPATVFILLLLLVASLALTACSSESSTHSVTDLLGRSVKISGKPARIVTTHPTATETLYRAGGVAVGRDTSSQYPAEVLSLPTVGSAYNINTESVAGLDPDMVLIEALTQSGLVDPLEQLGMTVIAVRAASLDDILQSLTLVAEIIDTEDTADEAISDIEDRIDAAKGDAPEAKSILIFIADAQNNIYAAKPSSYPGLVAALTSLENLAADLPDAGGMFAGYAPFSAEQATQIDPDLIFTITPAPQPAPRLSVVLSQMPGFKDMPAVKAGDVVELDPVLFLQAQGPRIADAVEELVDIMNNTG